MNTTFYRLHDPTVYWTNRCVESLRLYYTPVVVGVGLTGNALNYVALSHGQVRKSSGVPYLQALSTIDALFLVLVFLIWLTLFDVELITMGGGCQAITLLTSICNFLTVWLTFGMQIDRFLWSWFPQHRITCTHLKGKVVVICFSVLAVIIYLNLCLFYGVIDTMAGPVCVPLPHASYVIEIYRKIDLTINFGIAYLCIVVLSLLNTRALINNASRLNKDATQETPANNRTPNNRYREKAITLLVSVSTLIFLICNLPGHTLRLLTLLVPANILSSRAMLVLLWQQILLLLYFSRSAVWPWLCILSSSSHASSVKSLCRLRRVRDDDELALATTSIEVTAV